MQKKHLDARVIASKARSKYEIGTILKLEVRAMIPDHDHCNIWFYKQLCSGERVSIDFEIFSWLFLTTINLNLQALALN